jgi:hypothetical protein
VDTKPNRAQSRVPLNACSKKARWLAMDDTSAWTDQLVTRRFPTRATQHLLYRGAQELRGRFRPEHVNLAIQRDGILKRDLAAG